MGVGGNFWEILKPYCRFEGFDYLRNKRVAVDLSFWIVQHETALKSAVRNPHLRLTFFRTINLFSKFGVLPVFVVDGAPSPLKSEARIRRFFGFSGVDLTDDLSTDQGAYVKRNQYFQKCVRECVELLELLGMPVLTAKGEAEALCAQLNHQGHVEACITTDSDAFLFGATCVVKSIQPNSKEPFECYHMSDISTGLGLKRNHLIAVSVLVGNDHDLSGVQGIGVDTAVRFVKRFSEDEVLNRLSDVGSGVEQLPNGSIRLDKHLTPLSDKSVTKPKNPHCSSCGHPGNKTAHRKVPCQYCCTTNEEGCNRKPAGFKCACCCCVMESEEKEKRKNVNWHLQVCKKIAAGFNFPKTEIIKMYLDGINENDVSAATLTWKSPQIGMLVDFLSYHQHWEPSYIKQRMLPMLSTIFLREMAVNPTPALLFGQYEFDSIHRVKVRYGHQLYVVKWKKPGSYMSATSTLVEEDASKPEEPTSHAEDTGPIDISDGTLNDPDDFQIHVDGGCSFILTDENMDLVQDAFPEKVKIFHQIQGSRGSKRKSMLESPTTPKSEGRQATMIEYFRSMKVQSLEKPVRGSTAKSDILSSGSSSSNESGSIFKKPPVRRRLFFD